MIGNGITQLGKCYNYVRYIDINSNFFQLSILTTNSKDFADSSEVEKMLLDNRIYIVNGTGADYSNGYILGFEQGKEEGITQGTDIGYDNGYKSAKDYYYNLWYLNRYEQGRQAGVESAGKYTWLGLFGSIIDAPITAVRGLLNFDLLGFNMFNAFSALVTVAIIIAIIRMVL